MDNFKISEYKRQLQVVVNVKWQIKKRTVDIRRVMKNPRKSLKNLIFADYRPQNMPLCYLGINNHLLTDTSLAKGSIIFLLGKSFSLCNVLLDMQGPYSRKVLDLARS